MTLAELLVAAALTLTVMAGVMTSVAPAYDVFATRQEAVDLQQRLRIAADTLRTAVRGARSIRPYRVGQIDSDAAALVFFRPDVISVVFPPAAGVGGAASATYYVNDRGAAPQLMHYDGGGGDFPLIENVAHVRFEYFGTDRTEAPLSPAAFIDGPWVGDPEGSGLVDADVLEITLVRVHLGVQAPELFRGPSGALFLHAGTARAPRRYVPDQDVQFDVSPRSPLRAE